VAGHIAALPLTRVDSGHEDIFVFMRLRVVYFHHNNMKTIIVTLALFCVGLVIAGSAEGNRVLVLLDDSSTQQTHSLFFHSLSGTSLVFMQRSMLLRMLKQKGNNFSNIFYFFSSWLSTLFFCR
jgi:hypothetical protein